MRVKESIEELRQICQRSRDDAYDKRPWPERRFARPLSIYFTRLFLELGISANQASLIGLILILIGGALLILPNPSYWIIGISTLLLSEVVGNVDGEIARYSKKSSTKGAFWNAIPEYFVLLYVPACMSFGLYNALDDILPLAFGFLAVVALSMTSHALLVPYPILREKDQLSRLLDEDDKSKSEDGPSTGFLKRYRHFVNHLTIVFFVFLVCSAADCAMGPFAVGTVSLNARYVCLMVYTAAWVSGAIWNIYVPLRRGIELRL